MKYRLMVTQGLVDKLDGRSNTAVGKVKSRPTKADYASIVRENEALKAQIAKCAKEKRRLHSFMGSSRQCLSLSDIGTDDLVGIGVVVPKYEPGIAILSGGEEYLADSDKPQKRKTDLGSKMSHNVMKQGKIGRRHLRFASENTGKLLNSLTTPRETVPEKTMKRLESMRPAYLSSNGFQTDLMILCEMAKPLLENEPRCLRLQSPCHVFGDIHGNMEEIHFFSEMIWPKGVHLTPGKFVFLGDYVDRGMHSLECVAYLLAMKIRNPTKVYLLRGNHELRDVNSWDDFYGERCLVSQCRRRFGALQGMLIWERINEVFDRFPLAAVIDEDIFCIHGGIPRPVNGINQVDLIMKVPPVASISPPYPFESRVISTVAHQCLWSDPVKPDEETRMDCTGFGSNPRGNTAQCYGRAAVDNFLSRNDFSYIIRAHEKTIDGMSISKDARVITVFSTSKDHNLGSHAVAACLLIDDSRIEVITKDPSYERIRRMNSGSCSSFQLYSNSEGVMGLDKYEVETEVYDFDEEGTRNVENISPDGFRNIEKGIQKKDTTPLTLETLERYKEEESLGIPNHTIADETAEGYKENGHLAIMVPPNDSFSAKYTMPAVVQVSSSFSDVVCSDTPRCMDINRRDSLDPNDFKELRLKSEPVILNSTSKKAAENCNNKYCNGNDYTCEMVPKKLQDCPDQKQVTKSKSKEGGIGVFSAVSHWATRRS